MGKLKNFHWETFEDPAYYPTEESQNTFEGWQEDVDELEELGELA